MYYIRKEANDLFNPTMTELHNLWDISPQGSHTWKQIIREIRES